MIRGTSIELTERLFANPWECYFDLRLVLGKHMLALLLIPRTIPSRAGCCDLVFCNDAKLIERAVQRWSRYPSCGNVCCAADLLMTAPSNDRCAPSCQLSSRMMPPNAQTLDYKTSPCLLAYVLRLTVQSWGLRWIGRCMPSPASMTGDQTARHSKTRGRQLCLKVASNKPRPLQTRWSKPPAPTSWRCVHVYGVQCMLAASA